MKIKTQKSIITIVATLFILVFILKFTLAGGFASTYVPTIDGKQVMVFSNSTEQKSYFIYLQNNDKRNVLMKINISDNGLMQNTINGTYNVPSKTLGESYPIELKLKLPSTISVGQVYQIRYYISSASINEQGMITLAPASFEKTFYVSYNQPKWATLITTNENIYSETEKAKATITEKVANLFSDNSLQIVNAWWYIKIGLGALGVALLLFGAGVIIIKRKNKGINANQQEELNSKEENLDNLQ